MKTQYDSYIQTAAIKTDSTGYFYGEIEYNLAPGNYVLCIRSISGQQGVRDNAWWWIEFKVDSSGISFPQSPVYQGNFDKFKSHIVAPSDTVVNAKPIMPGTKLL
jgi:hypothetical protein